MLYCRLQEGVGLVNELSNQQFRKLCEQILQTSKDGSTVTLEQLQNSLALNLEQDKLQLLVQSVTYILKQSLNIVSKPTVLQKQLVDTLGIENTKADEFVTIWRNEAKQTFLDLKNQPHLESFTWELNLQTSSSADTSGIVPNVRLKLDLGNSDASKCDNVAFELHNDEILMLYNSLETIQNKLDYIQNATK